jgi:hypothetical protein
LETDKILHVFPYIAPIHIFDNSVLCVVYVRLLSFVKKKILTPDSYGCEPSRSDVRRESKIPTEDDGKEGKLCRSGAGCWVPNIMTYGEARNLGRISIGEGKLMEDLKDLKKKKSC